MHASVYERVNSCVTVYVII